MKKAITGCKKSSKITGAPQPSRDLFVYRVERGTTVRDIDEYLKENDIKCRSVKKVSKDEAKFASFKVEFSVEQFKTVLEPEMWPEGVHVRKFFNPRNNTV